MTKSIVEAASIVRYKSYIFILSFLSRRRRRHKYFALYLQSESHFAQLNSTFHFVSSPSKLFDLYMVRGIPLVKDRNIFVHQRKKAGILCVLCCSSYYIYFCIHSSCFYLWKYFGIGICPVAGYFYATKPFFISPLLLLILAGSIPIRSIHRKK